MSDLLLKERQDGPIWNAIEASNFKQALKLIDKRLAKKKTPHLEAFKIYVRSRSSSQIEKDAVFAHIESLATKKAALTDLEDIELYDDALDAVMPNAGEIWSRTIGELRWQAVKALPKQEELGLKSFKACLAENDLEHAQQIASNLEKSFPGQHEYVFWNISSLFLRSMSQDLSVDKRTLWGRLAFGQIGKLATATIGAESSKPLPTRAIHSPQELLLLQRIAAAHGKVEDRLKYLNEASLGPESTIAKGNWELWRNKLQLMEKSEQWQQLFDTSSELLRRARTKNDSGQIAEARMADWVVWQAYLRSAVFLRTPLVFDEVSAEIAAHLDPTSGIDKTWRRNASLAWLDFTVRSFSTSFMTGSFSDANSKVEANPQVAAIIKYLQQFGDATTAYSDLRPYVEQISAEQRSLLLKIIRSGVEFQDVKKNNADSETKELSVSSKQLGNINDITRIVNLQKLSFLIVSSIPEHERRSAPLQKCEKISFVCKNCSNPCNIYCNMCLEQLAGGCIAAYETAMNDDGQISKSLLPTDRHPGDDFCTLAAICLLKISVCDADVAEDAMKSHHVVYALQAAILLEYGWSKSKANSDFSLLLVRVYSSLGCGSQAMKAYLHLNLKQIQLDTLGYTILDRISSLHPHPFPSAPDGSSDNHSPLEHLKTQQKMYRNIRGQVTKNIWKAFEHGSYDAIFQLREFSDVMSNTISAASSITETQKVGRLLKSKINKDDIYNILPKNPELSYQISDTCDYNSFPGYDSTMGLGSEKLSRYAPGPSANRSRANLLAEKLISIIETDQKSQHADNICYLKKNLLPGLSKVLEQTKPAKTNPEDSEFTASELLAIEAYSNLANIIVEACDGDASSESSELEASNKCLHARLEEQKSLIEGCLNPTPALWNTLHILYTAHELASTITTATKHLSQAHLKVNKSQIQANKGLAESAKDIMQAVKVKSKNIKDGLGESGWIDRVLESIEVGSLSEQLRIVVGENFVEEWAGEVVESWRESVTGLGYLM